MKSEIRCTFFPQPAIITLMKALPRTLLSALSVALLAMTALGESTATLLTEAQTAYLRGDLETAKRNFELVNQIDSHNTTAINYLRMIKVQQAKGNAASKVEKELATVVLPQVQFREATLGSALDALKRQIAKASEGKVNVSFVLQLPEETVKTAPVTLNLSNVPAKEVLRYMGELVNVTFAYEAYAIVVRPKVVKAEVK
ncbi:MAG: hypothetical protein JWL59_5084 [Chthoniobacteraceae bacterium]|nr:hypothetical protein [Chthoniobacteraceae bacterium]